MQILPMPLRCQAPLGRVQGCLLETHCPELPLIIESAAFKPVFGRWRL